SGSLQHSSWPLGNGSRQVHIYIRILQPKYPQLYCLWPPLREMLYHHHWAWVHYLSFGRGKHVAFIDWQLPPSVEIQDVVQYQPVSSWMRFSRCFRFKGMKYQWVPHNSYICLYTNERTPELLARVSRARDSVSLEVRGPVIRAGLLEAIIVATALLQCGRHID
ncbi:hypothetical protein BD779DRAFT_1763787, partial [Infundibulicybe gibba]